MRNTFMKKYAVKPIIIDSEISIVRSADVFIGIMINGDLRGKPAFSEAFLVGDID